MRRGRSGQALIISMLSLFFIYHPLSFFSKPLHPLCLSLCVLPHGFPLQQCVALVITSCLKQTDGIRESDGQFSQCLFSPRTCTHVPFFFFFFFFCVSVLYASFTLLSQSPFLTPPPHRLSLCEFAFAHGQVCVCVCVCSRRGELPDRMC